MNPNFENIPSFVYVIIGLWSAFWKGLALWAAAKKNRKYWFITILFLNTIGVLPLIFLIFIEKEFLKSFFTNIKKRFI